MIFPLRVKLYKELLGVVEPDKQEIALNYIRKKIEEKLGDNIFTRINSIEYKGSIGNQRHGLLASVDGGNFSLIEQNGKSRITYEFTFRQLFIFTGAIAIFMGLLSQKWWIAVIMFSWLCGMNWLTAIARHENFLLDIKTGINNLFFPEEKKQLDYEDKEKLKSWF